MYIKRRFKGDSRKDKALKSALQSINATQQLDFSMSIMYGKEWLKYQNKETEKHGNKL